MPAKVERETTTGRGQRDARLSLRTSGQQHQLIRRAAAALDKSVTDFVLDSVSAAAERVLADRRWFILDDAEWDRFQELLDAPTEPMPKLQRTLRAPTILDPVDD